MREIASFQNGVNIIGQPEYVIIYEDFVGEDNGIKLGSYTQKTFSEKIRTVFHRILLLSFLSMCLLSCSPEEQLTTTSVEEYSEFNIQDPELVGLWEHNSRYDAVYIVVNSVTHNTDAGKNSVTYGSYNSKIKINKNGFEIEGFNNKKLSVVKQSSKTIFVNGELFFKSE